MVFFFCLGSVGYTPNPIDHMGRLYDSLAVGVFYKLFVHGWPRQTDYLLLHAD